jgi:hypothetical protein
VTEIDLGLDCMDLKLTFDASSMKRNPFKKKCSIAFIDKPSIVFTKKCSIASRN